MAILDEHRHDEKASSSNYEDGEEIKGDDIIYFDMGDIHHEIPFNTSDGFFATNYFANFGKEIKLMQMGKGSVIFRQTSGFWVIEYIVYSKSGNITISLQPEYEVEKTEAKLRISYGKEIDLDTSIALMKSINGEELTSMDIEYKARRKLYIKFRTNYIKFDQYCIEIYISKRKKDGVNIK